MPDVLLASCAEAAGRDEDEPLLVAALAAEGLTASAADWADPTVDWSAATAVVVRSTWDYAPRRDEFLTWARRVEEGTRLANPAAVLAWNTDKRYLRELAGAGVPVVPTAWAEGPGDVDGALSRWPGDVVVKPVVSAGARDTVRFPPERRAGARELAEGILASGRAVMVQPYLARLDAEGETGLVYVGGTYSHAFGKGALLAGEALGPGLFAEETITARTAGPEQRALGDRVLAWVRERTGETPLYARVDLVPGDDGAPQVIEVELTEPSLFLTTDDGAAARFAAAIRSRIG
ncbi:ATP-grasp domain-containing protein [Geodermatophilus sp. FMUSA9-8]|uniref:ATP-grasp domain-containing protein n=1 Tax=Geodermatophilus sp. FMUSA9-8 TaxID=3120155 RepID=UPI0030086450